MNLQNITPIMTSNTAPSPYVVSASSTLTTFPFAVYKAFDNADSGSEYDVWASNGIPSWIQIDFGDLIRVDAFSVTNRKANTVYSLTGAPKTFTLSGSIDGTTFVDIMPVDDQTSWTYAETRNFILQNSVQYRFYRITFTASNGDANIAIGEVKFYQYVEEIAPITYKKINLNYCLPKNSTENIKARTNDSREGFLGFADDSNNYGSLWMINNKGTAQMPMAGIKIETIWSGSVTGYSNISLTTDIDQFKLFLITHNSANIIATKADLPNYTGTITRIIGIY